VKRIGKLQEIVANGQAGLIDNFWMDTFTAQMLIAIYNALSPENQDKFDSIPLPKLVDFGWKHVRAT
jgi:hypothetical protein